MREGCICKTHFRQCSDLIRRNSECCPEILVKQRMKIVIRSMCISPTFDTVLLTVYYGNWACERSFLKHDRSPCVSAFHTRPLQLAVWTILLALCPVRVGRTGVVICLLGHHQT